MSMNNCTFIGRICNEIEVKTSSGGKSFARFNIAVSRSYVKEGSERESDFIPISVFGKTADFVGKYFKKGQEIAIIGELHSSSFTDKEGNQQPLDKITKDDILFLIDAITDPERENEQFEIDDLTKIEIKNEAHKVIYQNLGGKLQELIDNRTKLFDEAENTYEAAINKYSVN